MPFFVYSVVCFRYAFGMTLTVLIETKQNFTKADEEQLSAYVEYEKALTGNKTVAILANTMNDTVRVWRGVVSDSDLMTKETTLRSMDEYVDFYTSKINDKEKVIQLWINAPIPTPIST